MGGAATAVEVLLITDENRCYALRSDRFDESRPKSERAWDGRWKWDDQGGAEPRVTLFVELFAKTNRFVPALDKSYRALESSLRNHNCATCHSPDNPARINQLSMLIYPNQALAARHTLVEKLDQNTMPPGVGIADEAERARLIDLAKELERTADLAINAETVRGTVDRSSRE